LIDQAANSRNVSEEAQTKLDHVPKSKKAKVNSLFFIGKFPSIVEDYLIPGFWLLSLEQTAYQDTIDCYYWFFKKSLEKLTKFYVKNLDNLISIQLSFGRNPHQSYIILCTPKKGSSQPKFISSLLHQRQRTGPEYGQEKIEEGLQRLSQGWRSQPQHVSK
jgi:hypothetical protein